MVILAKKIFFLKINKLLVYKHLTNGKSDVVPIFLHQDMTKTPKEVYRILQMFRYFCPENNKKGKNKIGFVNIKQKDDFIS